MVRLRCSPLKNPLVIGTYDCQMEVQTYPGMEIHLGLKQEGEEMAVAWTPRKLVSDGTRVGGV